MIYALEAKQLGKRYGKHWALQNCTLQIPVGRVVGLVGLNGAGKTTLLQLAAGLLAPTTGSITVFDLLPFEQSERVLGQIGFLAQERSLYRNFSVGELLLFGQKLNPGWDADFARTRLDKLGISPDRAAGKLSIGQQTQIELILALAKKPRLLLLDEPLASLDPLARRDFEQTLMDAVAEQDLTVLFSSHQVNELERICDYLIILSQSHVQAASDIEQLISSHKRLVGPVASVESIAQAHHVIQAQHAARYSTLLVQTNAALDDPEWQVQQVSLEDIVLAYISQPASSAQSGGTKSNQEGVLL
jgi:ABC-2 type transport system ATP-binding protein